MAAKIALGKDTFATVDDVDWSFAYYASEWRLAGGVVKGFNEGKPETLHEFVGKRMGIWKPDVAIAVKDGDPTNCTRENLYATAYAWKKGTITRTVEVEDEKGKKTKEQREHEGWHYGNVGICQGVGRDDSKAWTIIHLASGLSLSASWVGLKNAQYGVELLHSKAHLGELDFFAKFSEADMKRWRTVIREVQSASAGPDAEKPGPPPPNRFEKKTTGSRKPAAAAAKAPSKGSSASTTTPAPTRRRGGGSSSTTAKGSASKGSPSSRSRKPKRS